VSTGVCPSVTLVYCIPTAEDVKLLRRPGSLTVLALTPSAGTQFQKEPLHRGRKIKGVGIFVRFSTEIAVYLGYGT